MSFHEQFDPTIDLLRRLPQPSPEADATARVRRRCHAALARRTAHRTRAYQPNRWRGQVSEAVWIVPLGLYLLASIIETVRVASSL
jgi:hypothetical protein